MPPLEQTPQQKANTFRDAGVTIPPLPVSDISKSPVPIAPSPISPATPIPFDPAQIISESQKYVQSFDTPNENKLNNVEGLLEQIGIPSRVETRQTKETELGLPNLRKTVNDLTAQLYSQKAQYENVPQQVNDVYSDSDALQSFLDTRTTSVQNRIASQQRLTAASLMAAQGNLTAAQQLADQSVDDEFFDIEQRQTKLKEQRQFLIDAVARDEVKLTKAQNLALKKAEREQQINDMKLAEAKDERKSVLSIMNTLAQYGVDPNIRNKVAKAKTVEEAYALAGASITDPKLKYELEGLRLDSQLKRASIANINDQIRSRQADDAEKRANGGLTPSEAKEARKEAKIMQATKEKSIARANEVQALIKEIKSDPNLARGTGITSTTLAFLPSNAAFQAKIERVKALLSLDSIKEFKGTGAMSDREFGTASSAATSLNTYSGQAAVLKELERIDKNMENIRGGENTTLDESERAVLYDVPNASSSPLPVETLELYF